MQTTPSPSLHHCPPLQGQQLTVSLMCLASGLCCSACPQLCKLTFFKSLFAAGVVFYFVSGQNAQMSNTVSSLWRAGMWTVMRFEIWAETPELLTWLETDVEVLIISFCLSRYRMLGFIWLMIIDTYFWEVLKQMVVNNRRPYRPCWLFFIFRWMWLIDFK